MLCHFWLQAVEEIQPKKMVKKLPWRAKPRLPCERALKTVSETGVKVTLLFILGHLWRKQTVHSGLACVNFVFQIRTTQKVFWPLKIIIQIVFKWFWVIVPSFNYFEAIFAFWINYCGHLPYESEDLKPPNSCPWLLMAVRRNRLKCTIIFIILDPKRLA